MAWKDATRAGDRHSRLVELHVETLAYLASLTLALRRRPRGVGPSRLQELRLAETTALTVGQYEGLLLDALDVRDPLNPLSVARKAKVIDGKEFVLGFEALKAGVRSKTVIDPPAVIAAATLKQRSAPSVAQLIKALTNYRNEASAHAVENGWTRFAPGYRDAMTPLLTNAIAGLLLSSPVRGLIEGVMPFRVAAIAEGVRVMRLQLTSTRHPSDEATVSVSKDVSAPLGDWRIRPDGLVLCASATDGQLQFIGPFVEVVHEFPSPLPSFVQDLAERDAVATAGRAQYVSWARDSASPEVADRLDRLMDEWQELGGVLHFTFGRRVMPSLFPRYLVPHPPFARDHCWPFSISATGRARFDLPYMTRNVLPFGTYDLVAEFLGRLRAVPGWTTTATRKPGFDLNAVDGAGGWPELRAALQWWVDVVKEAVAAATV